MNKNQITAVLITLCMCLSFIGAGWFSGANVVIDTEENKVYQYRTADEIISEFKTDHKAAKEKYNNHPRHIIFIIQPNPKSHAHSNRY